MALLESFKVGISYTIFIINRQNILCIFVIFLNKKLIFFCFVTVLCVDNIIQVCNIHCSGLYYAHIIRLSVFNIKYIDDDKIR